MKIRWLGHACFRVDCEGYSVVIDPFEPGSVPGIKDVNETADAVLCSHEHGDHGCRKAVKLTGKTDCPLKIKALPSFHDDKNGELRGKNIIHVIEGDGVKIAHFGDVGCMPDAEALKELQNLDAVMMPVGGHYTVNAEEAMAIIDAIEPKVVIPMHYRSDDFGFDVIGPVDDFLDICGRWVRYDTDTIEITPDIQKHTAVLKYCG